MQTIATNDNNGREAASTRTSEVRMGLGPNQLKWLRRNMDSFREAEEQRYYIHQDAVRAARLAGIA